MRIRPLAVIIGVFAAAALAAAFVVSQLPREGELSPAIAPPAPRPARLTPPLERAPSPSDGTLEAVVTAGGEPLEGAEVSLYLVRGAGPDGISSRRAGEGRTDAEGHARIPAALGAYVVVARAAGLAPARALAVRPAGEAVTRAELSLSPAAALEVRVTTREAPPAGARVILAPVLESPGLVLGAAPPEETAAAELDGGAARIEGIAPGTYRLDLEAPGFHRVTVRRVAVPRAGPVELELEPLGALAGEVLHADGRPAGGALVRAVSPDHEAAASAGADGRFTIRLPAGEYDLRATAGSAAGSLGGAALGAGGEVRGLTIRLGPAAVIEGDVVQGGRPRPGAAVLLLAHGATAVVARGAAGADGRFRFEGLAPGVHDVVALAPGATPVRVEGVTVASAGRFPLRLTLPGLGAVEGTVADAAGHPLAGARVRVVSRGDGMEGSVPLEARTDFDGRYRLEGVEAGRAELVAVQAGAALGDARATRIREGQTSRADFFVPSAGVLEGRVSRAAGTPLGAAVVAAPLRPGLAGAQVARALADATGNYRLTLPAGEYRVQAGPPERSGAELRATPAFTRVEPGRTAHLDLVAAATRAERGLEVLVLEPGGAPSAGAVVTLSWPGDGKVALAAAAGDDGRVSLEHDMGLSGGAVTIRARNGGRSGAFTGRLPASGTVLVRLAPGGALSGVVRAAGGPVSGFTLEVASGPSPKGWRTLDVHRFAGDRFELGDVPAEPLRLAVRTDDGRRGEAEVRLGAGEARTLEVALGGVRPAP
jgi:hypothetical protein